MKSTAFLFILLAALTACSTKSSDPNATAADSTAIDTTLTEKADTTAVTKSEAQQETTAPDLVTNGLKGHVKKMVQYYDETDRSFSWIITYTQDGTWATTNGVSLKKFFNEGVKRDAKGRIIALDRNVEETCETENDTYTYDEQGRVKKETNSNEFSTSSYTYSYNSEGEIISAKVKESDAEESDASYTLTYKILQRDDHGNWTRRIVSGNGQKCVTKRIITYWD